MATATRTQGTAGQERRIELNGVDWATYRALLRSDESQRGSVRMMYDRGRLVLMSPSRPHEVGGERLGLIVRLTAMGLGRNCLGIGRTTLLREEAGRGKEADSAFYLANEPLVRGKSHEHLDLAVDPPPDLAIEVEISYRDKGMLGVYAALRVPEVWLYDGQVIRVLQLQADGRYEEVAASPSFPTLPLEEIPRWLERAEAEGETAMMTAFLDWVRNELAPGRPTD